MIATAPTTPGVYTWRGAGGHPLYIGKALNLKSRLSSYRKPLDPRIAAMVQQATLITWEKTDTDIEALILESKLIKEEHPVFNIMLRDDKQYFYVECTSGAFPRIAITHQPTSNHSIGPFTEGIALKATLRLLRKLFPYCTCPAPRDPAKRDTRHNLKCLNAHIGRCPGFCCLKTPATKEQQEAYAKNLRAIRDILTGKRATVIRNLKRDMKAAGVRHELERALDLQKKLGYLERVFENAQVNARNQGTEVAVRGPRRVEGYDVANIGGQHAVGSMVVFTAGRPNKKEYRLFNIKTSGGDTDMLHEMLERRLKHERWPRPDFIVVDGGKAQLNVVQKLVPHIPVIAVTKDDRHQPTRIYRSGQSAATALSQLPRSLRDLVVRVDAEAHRFAISHYRKRHRAGLVRD